MKKIHLIALMLCLPAMQVRAQVKIWASAVCLHVNGSTSFYNTFAGLPDASIGDKNLGSFAGVFGGNTGSFKLIGGALYSSRTVAEKICEVALHYTVYPQGNRPAQPIFTSLPLHPACQCDGRRFAACGGARCNAVTDQKFENVNQQLDFTNLPNGSYTIELYYTTRAGETGCTVQTIDDNNGSGYKSNFIITNPLAINFLQLSGTAFDDYVRVSWKVSGDEEVNNYVLEKSLNGINFFELSRISAQGQSTAIAYQGYDNSPVIGTNYYRIKTNHINGSASLSRVFRIYYGKVGNTIFVYPATEGLPLRVRLVAVPRGHYSLSVYAQNGQQLANQMLQHDGVDKNITVAMPTRLARGVYRLLLIDKDKFFKQSFLVQ